MPRDYRKPLIDLTGKRFGKLVVESYCIEPEEYKINGNKWNCICDCGNRVKKKGNLLRAGETKSCGCLIKDILLERQLKHGKSRSKIYSIWTAIKQRCHNPNYERFEDYGGRGIEVCERWRESFENFLADMGSTHKDGLSLERKDVNKGYNPDNCIWITLEEQAKNTRRTVVLDTPWGKMSVKEASEKSGIPYQTLIARKNKNYSMEELFKLPKRRLNL